MAKDKTVTILNTLPVNFDTCQFYGCNQDGSHFVSNFKLNFKGWTMIGPSHKDDAGTVIEGVGPLAIKRMTELVKDSGVELKVDGNYWEASDINYNTKGAAFVTCCGSCPGGCVKGAKS